jgi:hypothetical protein
MRAARVSVTTGRLWTGSIWFPVMTRRELSPDTGPEAPCHDLSDSPLDVPRTPWMRVDVRPRTVASEPVFLIVRYRSAFRPDFPLGLA